MDLATPIILFSLSCILAGLALRSDSDARRLMTASVDGLAIVGSTIVRTTAHLNGRCGLLNHSALAPRSGLYLPKSRSVHTRGMLFAIDIVFLDDAGRVLAIHEDTAPGQGKIRGPSATQAVLELAAFAARREFRLEIGKVLKLTS